MSTADPWSIDNACLRRALTEFRATEPDALARSRLNDRLIDIRRDPFAVAFADPDRPGLFFARVPGTRLAVHFVLNPERRDVCVFSIADDST